MNRRSVSTRLVAGVILFASACSHSGEPGHTISTHRPPTPTSPPPPAPVKANIPCVVIYAGNTYSFAENLLRQPGAGKAEAGRYLGTGRAVDCKDGPSTFAVRVYALVRPTGLGDNRQYVEEIMVGTEASGRAGSRFFVVGLY